MGTSDESGRAGQTSLVFCEAATEIMRARQISVRQLAREVAASPSHVSRVLRGAQDKQPSIDLIERFAEALRVPPCYFLEVRGSAL